jgi:molybdopterin-binding protein
MIMLKTNPEIVPSDKQLSKEGGNNMKVSARNLLPGKIKEITNGAVNSEVIIAVSPGVEVVSIITKHSVESMGLKVGMAVKAMVKASNVMIVTD